MAFIAILTEKSDFRDRVARAVSDHHKVKSVYTWKDLLFCVKEQGISAVVVDISHVQFTNCKLDTLAKFHLDYPLTGVVVIGDSSEDPVALFELGQLGMGDFVLLPHLPSEEGILMAVENALVRATPAVCSAILQDRWTWWEREALWKALDGLHLGWTAKRYAQVCGMGQRHLGRELKSRGFPGPGQFLMWVRMLQAAQWLGEPGRRAAAVSRQLGYSNPPAFFNALRKTIDQLPSEVAKAGGLEPVLSKFLSKIGRGTIEENP